MKRPYIFHIMKSHYCKFVFLGALFGSYFLIPENVFYGNGYYLAGAFMFVFALSVACIIRNVKEKILLARTYKTSILSIVLTALGLSALQVCGVGAPVCGATVGLGVLSVIFPSVFVDFLTDYSKIIINISIFFQVIALYFMNCFKIVNYVKKCNEPTC